MTTNPPSASRPIPPEELANDAIGPGSPLFGVIWINPQRMSGAPCFYGTRVPIKNLFDYLRAGKSINEFLLDFSGITRQQIDVLLTHAPDRFTSHGHAA